MDTSQIRHSIEEALRRPGEQFSRGARFLRFQVELWKLCARRLHENNLLAMSAALSFRTIFAIIPVLILGFLVLKSIGVVEDGKRTLRNLLNSSGLAQIEVRESARPTSAPASGEVAATTSAQSETRGINIADQIEQLVVRTESMLTVQRIGPAGALLLIWTALTLLITIEQSLNRIFEAPRSRAVARRILLFWSALTLGPVLIVAATYFSRLGLAAFGGIPGISWLTATFLWAAPIVVGILVVAMAYKLIPNTNVRLASAVGGAVVTVPLWLLARWAFNLYVERFVLKGNLYGLLGVVPLFMLWLNVSWTVFLFGAQLAYTATNLTRFRSAALAERQVLGPSDWLAVVLAVARNYQNGHGPAAFEDVVSFAGLSAESARRLLDRLTEAGLLCTIDDRTQPRYVLSRPASQINVVEVLDLADPRTRSSDPDADSVRAAVAAVQDQARAVLESRTLANLIDACPNGDVRSVSEVRMPDGARPTLHP